MAINRARQGAAGENANADDAGAGRPRMLQQRAVVLALLHRRGASSRRVEHVVDDLGAAEATGIDHLMQGCRVADRRDAQEADLAA